MYVSNSPVLFGGITGCNLIACESVTGTKLQSETSSARMVYEAFKMSVDPTIFFQTKAVRIVNEAAMGPCFRVKQQHPG